MRVWLMMAGLVGAIVALLVIANPANQAARTTGKRAEAQSREAARPPSHRFGEAGRSPTGGGGDSYAVRVVGTLALLGRGAQLVIVDVSDPTAPTQIAALQLPDVVRDIAFANGVAYVAATSAGLRIVDLRRPRSPVARGHVSFDEDAYGVDVAGGRVYVAARSDGLHVVDVRDPSAPRKLARVETPDEAVDVVIRDEYAYVAAWYESLRVLDISNPTAPKEVGFADYGSYDNGAAWSLGLSGDLALVATPEVGLRIADISDPAETETLTMYRDLYAPAAVAAADGRWYIADQHAGLRILDLSDPESPRVAGTLPLPGRAMAIDLADGYAYIAAREAGLRIVDISTPHAPVEAAHLDRRDVIVDVAVAGDDVYAAGEANGIVRFTAVDGALRRRGLIPGRAERVTVQGNRLYLAEGDRGVRVFDTSDRDQPREIAALDTPGEARGVAAVNDLLVLAAGDRGLRVLEPARGPRLREIGAYEADRSESSKTNVMELLRTPVAAWDVAVDGEHAYAAFDDGVRVVDLSEPSRPEEVGHWPTSERAYRLVVDSGHVFAACDDGIHIVNVAEPARPQEVAYLKTTTFATGLARTAEHLYVSDLNGHVTVVDVSNPRKPQIIGEHKVADRLLALVPHRGRLVLAAGREGVRVIDHPRSNTDDRATPTAVNGRPGR